MILTERLRTYLELVRFSHTIFALPFAMASMLVAAQGLPGPWTIMWILLCMVLARTSAMTFNRIVDANLDAQNPRTRDRHIPRGAVTMTEAITLFLVTSGLFIVSAYQLNTLAFALSPLALFIICGYSFMKRVSSLCHVVLGLALAIAPIGAWIAVTGEFGIPSLWLAGGVLLWVAGFDVIYALLDETFDRSAGLHSLVVHLGAANALRAAFIMHIASVILFAAFGWSAGLGWIFSIGVVLYFGLIIYEHSLVNPKDISRVNMAFFTVNGIISFGLFLFISADVFLSPV